jgi:fatty-acyl-CoA synthase
VVDIVGSSESGRQGVARGTGPARFTLPPTATVLAEDRSRVLGPDDGSEVGWLAATGPIPRGYLGDEAKTTATFPVVGGIRYVVAGDRARWTPDGLELLGRDSVCINTGGEKVFAEEVEEAVKAHPAVFDAIVVGRPSERWGEEVVAVVAVRPGADADDDAIRGSVAAHLARYKLPKAIVRVDEVRRTASGKPDYAWARSIAGA